MTLDTCGLRCCLQRFLNCNVHSTYQVGKSKTSWHHMISKPFKAFQRLVFYEWASLDFQTLLNNFSHFNLVQANLEAQAAQRQQGRKLPRWTWSFCVSLKYRSKATRQHFHVSAHFANPSSRVAYFGLSTLSVSLIAMRSLQGDQYADPKLESFPCQH